MIDFHIITRNKATAPHLDEALFSLRSESVHIIDHCTNIQDGRLEGYLEGNNDYVSFCDDDDFVIDIPVVKEYLCNHEPLSLYTNSTILFGSSKPDFYNSNYQHQDDDVLSGKSTVHQLMVVRRDVALAAVSIVTKKLPPSMNTAFDFAWQLQVAKMVGWQYLPSVHYAWRHWNSSVQTHVKSSAFRGRIVQLINT